MLALQGLGQSAKDDDQANGGTGEQSSKEDDAREAEGCLRACVGETKGKGMRKAANARGRW